MILAEAPGTVTAAGGGTGWACGAVRRTMHRMPLDVGVVALVCASVRGAVRDAMVARASVGRAACERSH